MKIKVSNIKLLFLLSLYLILINIFYHKLYLDIAIGADIYDYFFNLDVYAVQQRTSIIVPGKGYFYELISFLNLIFKLEAENLFLLIFNSVSFLLSLILFKNVFNKKNLLSGFFLTWMVLITPSVLEFLVSNVRSSFAFILFLIGLNLNSKSLKVIFFFLASLIHLLILPMIIVVFLFYLLKKTYPLSKFDTKINYIIIFIVSLSIFYLSTNFRFIEQISYGYFYIIFMLSFVVVFSMLNRCVKFIEGYLALSLMLLINISVIAGYDFSRYFPITIILFSIFLIKNDIKKNYEIFNLFYFFILIIEYVNLYRSYKFLSG